MVKSEQVIAWPFTTADPTTGAATDADTLPTASLLVNGIVNAATVTVTHLSTGLYKAVVTLPELTAGACVALVVAATVGAVAGEGVIWSDTADTAHVSEVAAASAALVLVTPAHKLDTDADGQVTIGAVAAGAIDNAAFASDVPTPGDVASEILATPANKLATDANGKVTAANVTPVTDISGLATKTEVLALSPVQAAPDISGLATSEDVDAVGDKVDTLALQLDAVSDGTTITQATIGTDDAALGRVQPSATISVYLGSTLKYQFTADADGDYSFKLPAGSTWTLKARAAGYQDTEAEVAS